MGVGDWVRRGWGGGGGAPTGGGGTGAERMRGGGGAERQSGEVGSRGGWVGGTLADGVLCFSLTCAYSWIGRCCTRCSNSMPDSTGAARLLAVHSSTVTVASTRCCLCCSSTPMRYSLSKGARFGGLNTLHEEHTTAGEAYLIPSSSCVGCSLLLLPDKLPTTAGPRLALPALLTRPGMTEHRQQQILSRVCRVGSAVQLIQI